MGKGQNNETKTVTKAEPWKPIQPYLLNAFKEGESLYQKGAPGYYPGQTVAPMSGYTQGSLNAMAQRAASGSPLMKSAQDELNKTISGQYLSAGNPYFQQAVDAAARPIREAFAGEVMPGIDSNFSAAGRYGSGMQQEAYNDANTALGRQISDMASQMAYQNYAAERDNQMRGMMFAPDMASQDYKDISMLGLAGAGYDQYNQQQIDAEKARYDYNANKDMQWLQNYVGMLGGAPPPTSTNNAKTPAPSPWATVAGLGLMGASALAGMPAAAPYNPGMVGTFY